MSGAWRDSKLHAKWWRLGKAILIVAILAASGWVFAKNLRQLDTAALDWQPGWLIIAGLAYAFGVAPCALFWWWSMRALGQRPGVARTVRAYYIGHLGKYVPGKALTIVLRTVLVRDGNVRTGPAAITAVYESLSSMAAGAMLAAILLAARLETASEQLGYAVLLLVLALMPIMPWVFNPLILRLTRRFRSPDALPFPSLGVSTLAWGIAHGVISWLILAVSLWATVRAVQPFALAPAELLDCLAFLCIAMVVAFFNPTPGGLGVREWLLLTLFTPSLGEGPATVVAILLRLTWIATEVLLAAVLYPWPWFWARLGRTRLATEGGSPAGGASESAPETHP